MLCMVSPSGVVLVFAFRFMLSEVSAFCTGGGPLRSGALRIVASDRSSENSIRTRERKGTRVPDPPGAVDVDRTDLDPCHLEVSEGALNS